MASGRPPGGIFERFWLDFGCSGGPSGTIFRACFEAFVLQLVAGLSALFSLVGLALGGRTRSKTHEQDSCCKRAREQDGKRAREQESKRARDKAKAKLKLS